MKNLGFKIYLLFVVSWFLHFGSRIPLLGLIRFDLILVIILFFLVFASSQNNNASTTQTGKLLRVLIAYSILTVPFVEWPGSVIRFGIPNFIKAIVFYYFTLSFIKTEEDLRKFLFVFLICQSWRILEPLYLHVTQGYWGAVASMANWEFLNRLSGAPQDIINPNGLAFLICTVLPFLYFMAGLSWKNRLVFVLLTPTFLYALALTGSRSGLIGLLVIFLGILAKSKQRLLVGASGLLIAVVGLSLLSPDMQDRYLSIFGKGEQNRATFEGRYRGVIENFDVVLHRPIFGHGLGTSREANANFGGTDQPAHNLYVEVGQELGLVGLLIFILFIKSIVSSFTQSVKVYHHQRAGSFLQRIGDAMQIWLAMNIVFSFASYGLSSYEWYLFAGFSVLLQRMAGGYVVGEPLGSLESGRRRTIGRANAIP